ncbi:hypothetical protein PAXINDRAFT_104214 [Paxillus involutus ATCC 200175]|uniref:Uncharacterized protein n=1 Tax=Paxillus involutus ATCC 200175 TaxID=664439 RepID=A0A0C9SS86_PAXIN|nr:hypothetical protein PAXINDRAFT_104214 [Paxillus involutus ATCC 200175]
MEDEVPSPPSPSSPSPPPSPPTKDAEETLPVPPTPSEQPSLWNYAGKLKDSDTIAAFSKASTNWRAKAMDAWGVRRGSNASASASVPEHSTLGVSTPSSTASDLPPRTSGWPSSSGHDTPIDRRGSLLGTNREDVIIDPPRPAFFRSPRESFLPQPRRQNYTAPPSPNIPTHQDLDEASTPSLIHKTKASLASFAASQLHSAPSKSAPRPLMLSSRELITSKPQSYSRSDGGTPLQRHGQWTDVLSTKGHMLRQESVSSTSSLSPSEAMNRPYSQARSAGTGPRSDYDSDGWSRKVPLNRRTVSPMALASRSPRLPWNVSLSPGHSSDAGMAAMRGQLSSNGSMTEETTSERGWRHFEERAPTAPSTSGFDSPTTISSPPIPPTPLTTNIPAAVHIVTGGGGGHIGTGSVSTISEEGVPLELPTQSRLHTRKKTPPPVVNKADGEGDTSDGSSLSLTPSTKIPSRLRSKRYAARPANLRIRENSGGLRANATVVEQRTPSPNTLAPEWPEEHESATTPRAGDFGANDELSSQSPTSPRVRKTSGDNDGVGTRSRKVLGDGSVRLRKVSTGSSREVRRSRDSAAEEGDDEGYDDLLSAYESEEGSRE